MSNIQVIKKTVSDSGTPEVLGDRMQKFKGVVFLGCKGDAEVANAGTVYVQIAELLSNGTTGDWVSAMKITTGNYSAAINSNTLGSGNYNASQFRIKVANNGDGVVAIVLS